MELIISFLKLIIPLLILVGIGIGGLNKTNDEQ